MRRRLSLYVLPSALTLALALAGCNSFPSSSHSGASPRSNPAHQTTPAPIPGSTPSTSPFPGRLSEGSCTATQLSVTAGSWEGAGGFGGIPLRFTNQSTITCTLTGYPGAAVLNSSGQQVMQAIRTPAGYLGGLWVNNTVPVVTLDPGQTAAALLEWIENPQRGQITCPTAASIVVTPPNTYRSTTLPSTSTTHGFCADLQIHPVLPGTTGVERNES